MVDWLVNQIFKVNKLREAIFDEVNMYNSIGRTMNDKEAMKTAAKYWDDRDGWRGWEHNIEMNRYFFNDIAEHDLYSMWQELEDMQGVVRLD